MSRVLIFLGGMLTGALGLALAAHVLGDNASSKSELAQGAADTDIANDEAELQTAPGEAEAASAA